MPEKLWDSDNVCLELKDYLPPEIVLNDTIFSIGKKKLAWLETTASNASFEGFPNTFTLCLEKGVNDSEVLIFHGALTKLESLFPELKLYFWQER